MSRSRNALRVAVIAAASLVFNGEYYRHGPTLVLQPMLILLYVMYALTLEELVRAFRWGSREVFLFGATFGLVMEALFARSFFSDPPLLLGVNWIAVAIQVIYWGLLASVLALWAANRIIPRQDTRPLLGVGGRIGLGLAWAALLAAWWVNLQGPVPRAAALVLLLAAVAVILLVWGPRKRAELEAVRAAPNRVLTAAAAAHVGLGLLVGTAAVVKARSPSPSALVVWSWIFAGVVLGAVTGFFALRKNGLAV